MSKYLFVYGTLRPAICRKESRCLIEMLKPVGRGSVTGRLYDLGEYPGAVLDVSSETKIIGDLLELPDDLRIIKALDDYEGYIEDDTRASLFLRSRCLVGLDDGREIESWIYIYNLDLSTGRLIRSGDYLDLLNRSNKEWDRNFPQMNTDTHRLA